MNRDTRIKILKKIAQTAPDTKTVSGSPTPFTITSLFPSLESGMNAINIEHLHNIVSALDFAIYYTSHGDLDMFKLKSEKSFNFTTSDPDLKKIIAFTNILYKNLLSNQGAAFTKELTSTEIKPKVDFVLASPEFNALSSTNSGGQLATKIHKDLKSLIRDHLTLIK